MDVVRLDTLVHVLEVSARANYYTSHSTVVRQAVKERLPVSGITRQEADDGDITIELECLESLYMV